MKMTIDKNNTTVGMIPVVKAGLKEFKTRYTDNDLLNAFEEQTCEVTAHGAEIISATVEGFGTYGSVWYRVDIIAYSYIRFFKIHFYCDSELVLDDDPLLSECEVFKRV